jgi:hypothetical protein
MKSFKNTLVGISLFALLLSVNAGSAFAAQPTHVFGKVQTSTGSNAGGATVTVTCVHNGTTNVLSDTTTNGGVYQIFFDKEDCDSGDSVTIHAIKDGETGSVSTVIPENNNLKVDIMLAATAIPEFGLMTGVGAILTSAGAFYAMRRRSA